MISILTKKITMPGDDIHIIITCDRCGDSETIWGSQELEVEDKAIKKGWRYIKKPNYTSHHCRKCKLCKVSLFN